MLVVAEVAAGAISALWLGMRGWARSHESTAGTMSAPLPTAPGVDWTPAIALGVFAAGVAVIAVALLRARWRWAGRIQVLVALVLGAAVLAATQGSGKEPPAPAPTWNSPPCRGGSTSDECARSGG
ncbi:hypothetical protein GA0115243_106722 [Streptomyces sp. ScaeMP-e83]|nr:hypothetical protein GA0115243_106722 [Streptomyces sp. ScaeMP-e83]